MGNRLTKRMRLLNAAEYSAVFSQPTRRVSSRHLLLLAISNTCDCPRLGLVISRKHVGKAVARNRVKRLCRESFRLRQHQLDSLDIVVLARSGVGMLANAELSTMFNELLDRLSSNGSTAARSGTNPVVTRVGKS